MQHIDFFYTSIRNDRARSVARHIKTFLLLISLTLYGFNSANSQLTCGLKATVSVGTIKCYGGTTTLTVNATGGSGSYEYSINAGLTFQSSNVFNVAAGVHIVTVRDKNNLLCLFTTAQINVGQPLALKISASVGVFVNGLTTLTVSASGGVGIKLYSLNGGAYQTSNIFVGIKIGTYTCKVKDANGCIKSIVIVVGGGGVVICPTITIKATVGTILCAGAKTSLSLAASGGVGPYTYSINGGAYVSSNIFANLVAGVYTCKVKDSKGCIGTIYVTIKQPLALKISASVGVFVNGLTTLTVSASGGVGIKLYSLNGGAYQTSNIFVGIKIGTYTCKVKDANGCIKSIDIVVGGGGVVVCPTITIKATVGTILCAGGTTSLTLAATGGVGPYTYSINGGAYVSSNIFVNLVAGVYTCKVKDSKGCIGTISVTIKQPLALKISASAGVCVNGLTTLTVTAYGGVGTKLYSLNGGAYQSSNLFIGVKAGTYTCKVKDANGCIKTSASISVGCSIISLRNSNPNNLNTVDEFSNQSQPVVVKTSPNPYSNNIRFVIKSKIEGKSNLVLYTTNGAKIANVYQGYISTGTTKSIDYFVPAKERVNMIYVLTIGNHRETGKLITIK